MLLSGAHLWRYPEPGEWRCSSQAISQDPGALNVEAGKKYYVKGGVKMRVYAARPKFTQMSDSEALADSQRN